jgi:hypothetical protein
MEFKQILDYVNVPFKCGWCKKCGQLKHDRPKRSEENIMDGMTLMLIPSSNGKCLTNLPINAQNILCPAYNFVLDKFLSSFSLAESNSRIYSVAEFFPRPSLVTLLSDLEKVG